MATHPPRIPHPITNFPYVAFRALHRHWKVLFSQELTSFPKNRAELHCRASRRGACNSASWNWIYQRRRERGRIRSSRGKCLRDGAGEMGLLTRGMKLLKRQRHVYLTMKAVTVSPEARLKINTYTRHLAYFLICFLRRDANRTLSRECHGEYKIRVLFTWRRKGRLFIFGTRCTNVSPIKIT